MAPPSGELQLDWLKSQEARRWEHRETKWVGQGSQGRTGKGGRRGGPSRSQSQVSTKKQELNRSRLSSEDWRVEDKAQSDQTIMKKGLSLACHLAAVVVPLPLPAMMGLPWPLQFLERAKRLPDVGLVHAVPSLLAFPSPLLCLLSPGLVNSSSTFKHLPQPALAFSAAAVLHSCALQTQQTVGRQTQCGPPRSHKSKACAGLGEHSFFL